jgi:thiol:disulfide interchange protein DsbD
MIARSLLVSMMLATASNAAVRSGKANAEWIPASAIYQAGQPVQTAIRLTVDAGWHTYWLNPGEGGMKTSIEIEAPAGWTIGEPGHPVPKRFTTGGLPGFGYEGVVLFPVSLTPPAEAAGPAKLSAKISWLTCNDGACVPGNAELELALESGAPSPTQHAEIIAAAEKLVPAPASGVELDVTEADGVLQLRLELPAESTLDPASCEVFPKTAEAIDPKAEIRFAKSGGAWTANVRKSEYATAALRELTLVLAGKGAPQPVEVSWRAPAKP